MSTELICPRPTFLTGVVGHSQPSVGWEGTNRVRWQVSKTPVSSKPIFLTYVSLPFDVRQEKRLSGHGPLVLADIQDHGGYTDIQQILQGGQVRRNFRTGKQQKGGLTPYRPPPGPATDTTTISVDVSFVVGLHQESILDRLQGSHTQI